MPTGPRLYVDNGCFHVIARGNRKQAIFRNAADYSKYIMLLKKYKRKYGFSLYGYCLMPNHIHIVGQIQKAVNLSKLMHAINKTYATYFNNSYDKVGHLWQGRFKSNLIVKDQYFINCVNYIESNPVRAKIVLGPEGYSWSSYRERNMIKSDFVVLDPIAL